MLCYVGHRRYLPVDTIICPEILLNCHPKEFKSLVSQLEEAAIWTNNLLIVDCFSYDEVMVCSSTGLKPIDTHPKYHLWKNEFSPGEFWSLVGDDW